MGGERVGNVRIKNKKTLKLQSDQRQTQDEFI